MPGLAADSSRRNLTGRRATGAQEEADTASDADEVQVDDVNSDGEGDEGDEDEEDDEDESEEEEVIVPRVLPQRHNRGNKLAKLIQEGEDEDEFWDHLKEYFVENANDSDFEADEEEDLVDDDFDAPEEPPGDDDDDNDGTVGVAGDKSLQRDDRKQAKKPAPYVDPNRGKKSLSAPVPLTAAEKEAAAAAAKSARAARAAALAADRDHSAPADGIAGHRTQRKSAAKAQERREQDRAQQDAAFAARAKARGLTKEELLARQRDRAQVVYRMLTQEEQLEQAKITEVLNRNSLEELLRIEEAQKRITVRKRGVVGAAIFLRDRAGASTVAFKYCAPFDYARSPDSPAVSSSASVGTGAHHGGLVNVEPESSDAPFVPPARRRRLAPGPLPCFVTGAPAKYRDPVTGLPYATAAALQTLRQRVAAAAADGNGAGASELLQAYEARHFAPVPTAEALAEADAAVAAAAAGQAHAQMEMADHDDARVAAAKAGHGRGRKANPK